MAAPLKRHPALIGFSHEHHQGLLLAQVLKKNSPAYRGMPQQTEDKKAYLLDRFTTELKKHFIAEENVLFPFCTGKPEMDELIDDLIQDHAEMGRIILHVQESASPVDLMNDFGILLEQHIRKEERILFALIQEKFSEEELEVLKQRLDILST